MKRRLHLAMRLQAGFTLMEVLIAVTITAVIGIGVWQVVHGVINARDRVDDVADQFRNLQHTMLLLERDITQVVNRPARDVYGDFLPALTSRQGDFKLLLTHQGWRNPLGIRRSSLQRVGWEYTGNELRRRYWPMVDQGQDDSSRDMVLLKGVTAFDIRFLDDKRRWQPEWPTDETMATLSPGSRPEIALPVGIEITIEQDTFGKLVRTFALPDFNPEQAQSFLNKVNQANEQDKQEDSAANSGTQGQGGKQP
jgi:general secretion pathway protein J